MTITEVSPGHHVCSYSQQEETKRQKDLVQYIKDNTQPSYDKAWFAEVLNDPGYVDHGYPDVAPASLNRGTSHNRIS